MSDGPRINETPTLTEAIEATLAEHQQSPAWKEFNADARTVWVDVDGTLAIYHGWRGIYDIGVPIGGAERFMHRLRELGKKLNFRVGLYTVRATAAYPGREQVLVNYQQVGTEEELVERLVRLVEAWAFKHQIPFDAVWAGQGKPVGIAYIDDRGIHCSPQTDGPNAYEAALYQVEMMAKPKGK